MKRIFLIVSLVLLPQGLYAQENAPAPDPADVRSRFGKFVKSVPEAAIKQRDNPAPEMAKLMNRGRKLFFDKRVSRKGDRSCNDCHDLTRYGTNGRFARLARREGKLKRDVPSLFHVSSHFLFNWDGVTQKLDDAVTQALTDEHQMGSQKLSDLEQRLTKLPEYQETVPSVIALTTYIKGLITRSPFDKFLEGDDKALTTDQLKGALLFTEMNCSTCHTGASIGGQMLQKVGVTEPWPNQKDQGHYDKSKLSSHRMFFKVPGLRNVGKTAPYFHDRSGYTLEVAISDMARYEMGRYISQQDAGLIAAFLRSLTGDLPEAYIKAPEAKKP